jgi:hypothetical protein
MKNEVELDCLKDKVQSNETETTHIFTKLREDHKKDMENLSDELRELIKVHEESTQEIQNQVKTIYDILDPFKLESEKSKTSLTKLCSELSIKSEEQSSTLFLKKGQRGAEMSIKSE